MVADFIVDHATVETPQNYMDLKPCKLYFDGSNYRNGIGVGMLIILSDNLPTQFKYKIDGPCSNNEAEYEALISSLEILLNLGEKRVENTGESELVIKHITREYRCIKENLIVYFVIATRLIKSFDFVDIWYIPRLKIKRKMIWRKSPQDIKYQKGNWKN